MLKKGAEVAGTIPLLETSRVSDFGELSRAPRQGWAGEKSSLFEHTAQGSSIVLPLQTVAFPRVILVFSPQPASVVSHN
jgi:hypothetical protein